MATTDVVAVVIEIADQTKKDLATIRSNLEALGAKDINVDLDINSTAEIARTEAQLRALTRTRTLHFQTRMTPGVSGVGRMDRIAGDSLRVDSIADMLTPSTGGGGLMGGRAPQRAFSSITKPLENAREQFRGIRRTLGAVTPNIMDLWNALAALIPVMISLGAAAIGLAGAFITLGVAAAAIGGIGLLGFGDTFEESISNATQEIDKLGDRLFDMFQPVADVFQPILQGWLEAAPRQLQRLVEPLQRMAIFADTLGDAGAGFIGWVADALRSMASMEKQISQIALRFGDVAGTFIIDFMESMTQFAYENQEALILISHELRRLLSALLDLSIVVTTTLTALSPLVTILEVLAELLNTTLGRGLITMIGLLLMLKTAIAAANVAIWIMQGGILRTVTGILMGYIPALDAAILTTWQWFAALTATRQALVALLATTGIGLLLAGGGILIGEMMGGMGGGPSAGASRAGSSSGGTYINIEGDVGRRELDRLLSAGQVRAGDEHGMQEGMNNG